jgi:hypothetical protein
LVLGHFSENRFAETPENNCHFDVARRCNRRFYNELQRRPNGKELARFWPKIWPFWVRGAWPSDCLTHPCRRKPFRHNRLRYSPKTSKNGTVLAPDFRKSLRHRDINSVEIAPTPRTKRRAKEIPLPVCRTVPTGLVGGRSVRRISRVPCGLKGCVGACRGGRCRRRSNSGSTG